MYENLHFATQKNLESYLKQNNNKETKKLVSYIIWWKGESETILNHWRSTWCTNQKEPILLTGQIK